ncbi:RRM_3 domain-containing protein [Trichonephila clavipes]|nr:RRM_3 domain-containing protein [Trichonephila clavipes]
MSSSPVPLKTRHVGQRCTLNLPRAKRPPVGVVVRRGGFQLRCRPRHSTMVQNYEVPDDFVAGCLLKVCGLDEHITREVLKKELGEYGDISYVDYSRGNPEGVVRFEKAGIAAHILEKAAEEDGVKKFTFGSCKATISPVEGDSEQEYWKSIVKSKIDMKQKKFIDGRKGRFKKNFFGKRQRGNAQEAELAERWTELPQVSDESRSFFRVHTGYFSNIPKCIKAEFIASWGCSQSSVVSSSKR